MADKKIDREDAEQRLQTMYMQLQMMKEQLDEGIKNKMMLDQKMTELITTKNALNDLKKTKANEEIWAPLGSDTYAAAKLQNTSEVAINVGANVIVKKTLVDALAFLNKKELELQGFDKQLMSHIQQLQAQGQLLEEAMQSIISEAQKSAK